MARKRRLPPSEPQQTPITSLTHDGRGVARLDGKTVFVEGALPGETVRWVYTRRRRDFDEAKLVEVVEPSAHRVEPHCPHFGVCGGCSLQHLDPAEQVRTKQRILLDNLARLGKVAPASVLEPLIGPVWGYRRKARLGIRYVAAKGGVLVGFRERHSNRIAVLHSCAVLDPKVGSQLQSLAACIGELSCFDKIAQAEVAIDDRNAALVLRHLAPLSSADEEILTAFGERTGLAIYLQCGGPDTVRLLWPEQLQLAYRLDDDRVEIHFAPTDFTQVNAAMNQRMLDRVLTLIEVDEDDQVLDLFCGLGNFTLPLARRAAAVVGVEGDAGLIARARANASANALANVEFHVANLAESHDRAPWPECAYDKVLLDPPRSGAAQILPALIRLDARRIVYVSCNPATLARDAGILVREGGYALECAGVMDMFPHTAHVESVALFVRR